MSNKYNNGRHRLSVAGVKELQNKPIVISDAEGNDILKKADEAPSQLVVSGITTLTAEQLDSLKVGDIVVKKTGNSRHGYVVCYKNETAGELSMVYADAWNVEEVYYDKNGSGGSWQYVVRDITKISEKLNMEAAAPAYSNASTYTEGEFVTHGGKLYYALGDIAEAEAWTAAHWQETTIVELITALS